MSIVRWCVCASLCIAAPLAAMESAAAERIYSRRTADGLIEYSNQPSLGAQPVIFVAHIPEQPAGGRLFARSRSVDPTIDGLIRSAASTHRIEEALLRAVIESESNFDPRARSTAGAVGLMQLMPGTARRYGVADALDPAQNIDAGARYLKDLLALFDGDLGLALAAYNAGEAAVLRHGSQIPPFRETQAYVPAVLARYLRNVVRLRLDQIAQVAVVVP